HERVDQCAQIRQAFDRKPWLDDNRPCASTCLGHPRRQQRQREIRLPDNEVRYAGVTPRTDYRDGFTAARVKRIEDPNLNRRTPGSMTLLRPAWANLGLLVPSVTRLAATTALFSISGFPSSSPNSRSPAVTAAMPASCAVSLASSSLSSTIGASNRSTPAPAVTSTRSSRNAMAVARLSPKRCLSPVMVAHSTARRMR